MHIYSGLPGSASGKESACQCKRCKRRRFDPWVGKSPWRRGVATHSSILAWRIPTDRRAWRATVHGVAKSQTQLARLSTCERMYMFIVSINRLVGRWSFSFILVWLTIKLDSGSQPVSGL